MLTLNPFHVYDAGATRETHSLVVADMVEEVISTP